MEKIEESRFQIISIDHLLADFFLEFDDSGKVSVIRQDMTLELLVKPICKSNLFKAILCDQ